MGRDGTAINRCTVAVQTACMPSRTEPWTISVRYRAERISSCPIRAFLWCDINWKLRARVCVHPRVEDGGTAAYSRGWEGYILFCIPLHREYSYGCQKKGGFSCCLLLVVVNGNSKKASSLFLLLAAILKCTYKQTKYLTRLTVQQSLQCVRHPVFPPHCVNQEFRGEYYAV